MLRLCLYVLLSWLWSWGLAYTLGVGIGASRFRLDVDFLPSPLRRGTNCDGVLSVVWWPWLKLPFNLVASGCGGSCCDESPRCAAARSMMSHMERYDATSLLRRSGLMTAVAASFSRLHNLALTMSRAVLQHRHATRQHGMTKYTRTTKQANTYFHPAS